MLCALLGWNAPVHTYCDPLYEFVMTMVTAWEKRILQRKFVSMKLSEVSGNLHLQPWSAIYIPTEPVVPRWKPEKALPGNEDCMTANPGSTVPGDTYETSLGLIPTRYLSKRTGHRLPSANSRRYDRPRLQREVAVYDQTTPSSLSSPLVAVRNDSNGTSNSRIYGHFQHHLIHTPFQTSCSQPPLLLFFHFVFLTFVL